MIWWRLTLALLKRLAPNLKCTPLLRSGNAGSIYFMVNGVTMGPAGPGATIARDVQLSADAISANYAMADATEDPDLPEVAALVLGSGGTQLRGSSRRGCPARLTGLSSR